MKKCCLLIQIIQQWVTKDLAKGRNNKEITYVVLGENKILK